ncbi:hypothetical protein [Nocardia sp. NPDC049707]|uniref:hypothetical protein n=1 Tax=Nocardia sp. NPDC049707 TaxID=3154735 RepID=UPI0034435D4E
MTRPSRTRPVRTWQSRVTTQPQLMGTAVEANPDGFAERFTRLLDRIVAAPGCPVGEFDLLAPAERE